MKDGTHSAQPFKYVMDELTQEEEELVNYELSLVYSKYERKIYIPIEEVAPLRYKYKTKHGVQAYKNFTEKRNRNLQLYEQEIIDKNLNNEKHGKITDAEIDEICKNLPDIDEKVIEHET